MPLRSWRLAIPFIILALALSRVWAIEDQPLRVGLVRSFKSVKQITVLASSNYTLMPAGSAEKIVTCSNLEPVTINAIDTKMIAIRADGSKINLGASVLVAPCDPTGTISVDSPARTSKQYRGRLEVTLKSGVLQLVNILSIEDYLPGVIACEMPSSYPDEALKAQTVAARTYSISGHRKHISSGYDLCDDTHCQVYDGTLREKPSCTRAVIATKGQLITFNGQIASIMYGADCGGVTECPAKSELPYLTSVTEPAGVNHRAWENTYKPDELSAKLKLAGIKEAEGLKKLTITKTSPSGRALAVEIVGSKGSTTISGVKLRSLLGLDVIRSTLFTIEAADDGLITIKGRGYGHGIGLCQVGAKALAGAPFSYTCEQILAHYYPGTMLTPTSAVSKNQDSASNKQAKTAKTGPHPKKENTQSSAIIDVRVVEPAL